MSQDDSRSLLKHILGYFARKPPEKSPASLKSQALDAWVRTDAYLQHESTDFDEIGAEQVARTLTTFENLVQYDSDEESNSNVNHAGPYPKLQAVRSTARRPSHDVRSNSSSAIRISKRKRDTDAAIEELSRLETEAKRRRVLPREEFQLADDVNEPDADFAILMRKHSVSLHQGLKTHWHCVCQSCSGLSVRLSLPQRKKGSQVDACFEVFFGVRSLLAITLQEAKITIKDIKNDKAMGTSELAPSVLPELAHICKCIKESLDQRNCLNLLFEDGLFKRLRPQPKFFRDCDIPRTVSLTALFERQQELRGGSTVLPLKGKRILAVILATALLPFLETPWVQPSFDHSKIQFFQPLQDGELPDITKPFLAMEQVPIISADNMNSPNGQAGSATSKHMVHPNASVLALGILLCELHYCTTVEAWQNDTDMARNVNTDYYTSLEILKNLEVDAGVDYYLATKACLQWEYFPAGEPTNFESVSVQKLFHQNVVKRLEAEIFKMWRLRVEDLTSLDPRDNELCWGMCGREVVHRRTSRSEAAVRNNEESAGSLPSTSSATYSNHNLHSAAMLAHMPAQHIENFQNRLHITEPPAKSLYFFDASHQKVSEQEIGSSDRWMSNLSSSIYHHVLPFDATTQPTSAEMIKNGSRRYKPVRIAILDSGFDPGNPLLINGGQQIDPRIKAVQNFVNQTEPLNIQDEIGHGTHALGLLLRVATSAEIYIAKVANQETLGRNSYDTIAKAINYAVTEWKVDIISMSFGIREYHEPMKTAISNALHNQTLLFAAASNDGANLGRAFPAKYPSVFCIHATDGKGNPSPFNPTADEKDVNFSLLGEHVRSHWPAGRNGHDDIVNVMSGTSVATPIAAGLAASVLSFVRQQEQYLAAGNESLGSWLKDVHSMDAVLKSMVRQRRAGYDYITPHLLLDTDSSKEHVYNKIKDIKKHMYD